MPGDCLARCSFFCTFVLDKRPLFIGIYTYTVKNDLSHQTLFASIESIPSLRLAAISFEQDGTTYVSTGTFGHDAALPER